MTASEAQKAASMRWTAKNRETIRVNVPIGDKARLQAAAAARGVSVSALIVQAVNGYTGETTLTPLGTARSKRD